MNSRSIVAIKSSILSKPNDQRYVIIDKETGEILDNAQGYGYRSAQKAYAAYGYKNRDKSKDSEIAARKEKIRNWLKSNKEFTDQLEIIAWDAALNGDGKLDAKCVSDLLKQMKLHPEFTPGEILKVWKSM